jgi:thiol peroxidase
MRRSVMVERKDVVRMKDTPVTLLGPSLKAGEKAPSFKVLDRQLNEVGLKDFAGKVKLVSVTPSLDTKVCDLQARRFNEEAAKLSDDVVVLNMSMDLPFAIDRFCTTAGIDRVQALSDHRDGSFGKNYGVLIKELRLLARSIFVIDMDDTIRYVEIVPEATHHIDFEKALDAVDRLVAQRA